MEYDLICLFCYFQDGDYHDPGAVDLYDDVITASSGDARPAGSATPTERNVSTLLKIGS